MLAPTLLQCLGTDSQSAAHVLQKCLALAMRPFCHGAGTANFRGLFDGALESGLRAPVATDLGQFRLELRERLRLRFLDPAQAQFFHAYPPSGGANSADLTSLPALAHRWSARTWP